MGKVARLRNKIEPFAALFWALGIVNVHTCQQAAWPYKAMFGSILTEDALPPLSYLGMLFNLFIYNLKLTMSILSLSNVVFC